MAKKQKILTREQLKEKLKIEKAGAWMNGDPHFGIVNGQNGNEFFAINDFTEKQMIALFLLDAADYTTERVWEVLDLWKTRYHGLGWKPILVFQQKYLFLKNHKFFERYRNHAAFSTTPIFLDVFGETHEWAQSKNKSSLILMSQGKIFFKEALLPNLGDQLLNAEDHLQQALRIDDPGLPLPLLYRYENSGLIDVQMIQNKEVSLTGQWVEGNGTLMTEDQNATFTFPFEGRSLRLLMDLHPQAMDQAKVQITFDDQALKEEVSGPSLHLDDKGNTLLEINKHNGVYEIMKSEKSVRGVFKFKFVSVIGNPIIFYEMRIGSV